MLKNNLKFAFFGTPEIAAKTLEILKENGFLPSLIITAPDRPQGRKMIVTPPPVKIWAEENFIDTMQPEKIGGERSDLFEFLRSDLKEPIDLFIVVAYGQIFPEWLINNPKYGTLNIHYSLLPKYRGASPVQSAILNGDTETGVTIQKMVKKLDAGPIIAQKEVAIGPTETTPELLNKLVQIGSELLVQTLPNYVENKIKLTEQDENAATHCQKIAKEDGEIDPTGDAIKNYNKFRAYYEWPRTFFFKDNKRIIITDAELKDGEFIIKKVIPEGGKEMLFSASQTL